MVAVLHSQAAAVNVYAVFRAIEYASVYAFEFVCSATTMRSTVL